MEKPVSKKQSRTRQILLVILLIVILFAIGYFVYNYLIDRSGKTPEELASELLLVEEEIAEVTFEAKVITEPPFSDLKSYGQPIDVDKVKTGRDNPFISY